MFDENELPVNLYNPYDWYWAVGGSIYSSKKNAYVDKNDADFVEWKSFDNRPTVISEHDLVDVILPYDIIPPFCQPDRYLKWSVEASPPAIRHLYNKIMVER